MKFVFALLLVVAFVRVQAALLEHSPEEKKHWEDFKIKYAKQYTFEEETQRFVNFIKNLRKIAQHNKSGKSFSLKINKFGDWTHEEYKNFLKASSSKTSKFLKPTVAIELPTYGNVNDVEVDWRTKGVVTPVKDQGQCGSCYSFSATGALEGQYALKYGKLLSFSEKQFVDCSQDQGNLGCDGGLVEYCYDFAVQKGVMTEEDYGYVPYEEECVFDETKVSAKVSSYYNVPAGNEQALTRELAKTGPVAIAIDASNWSFQFYDSGVYDEPNCGKYPWQLDHAVLAVGYGTDSETDKDYYIVKNSWNADWGVDGYIYMTRNEGNQCGVATDAVIPVMV